MNAEHPNQETDASSSLHPGYIDSSSHSIFSWHHRPSVNALESITAIICNPMGYEYTHSHRSLKFLADTLSARGHPVFRFDFHGTGNSSGGELEEDKIRLWLADISSVISKARANYPNNKICLIGLRFGGTLASMASETNEVDCLILWEPIVNGRKYIRELTAIAKFSSNTHKNDASHIESAGFFVSQTTAEEIKKINLLKQDINTQLGLLYISRDDTSTEPELYQKLSQENIETTQINQPGYAEMMAEPQDTVIPYRTIETISQWLKRRSTKQVHVTPHQNIPQSIVLKDRPVNIEERACWYDKRAGLTGILCTPKDIATPTSTKPNRPAVIIVNSGSVHNMGPNRVYTHLARKLAELNFASLRIDIEGIGDSCALDTPNKNHPYQKNAVRNVFSAMRYLKQEKLASDFIIAGLCSGAHTAFHTALQENQEKFLIREIVLINPLTFYWKEGMSLDTPSEHQNIRDSIQYKNSFRNLNSWKKLLTGKAETTYIASYILKRIYRQATMTKNIFLEVLFQKKSRLAKDLVRVISKDIKIVFIFSSQDPGYQILLSEAKKTVRKLIRSKKLSLEIIEGSDHTFSKMEMRKQFYKAFTNNYLDR